jgi:hypothetical protein
MLLELEQSAQASAAALVSLQVINKTSYRLISFRNRQTEKASVTGLVLLAGRGVR